MSRFVDTFVQLRFLVASVLTLLSAFAAQCLGIPQHWLSSSLIFACSLGIYNLDHLVDRHLSLGRAPHVLASLSLLSVLGLLALSSPGLRVLVLGGGAGACLYFVPFTWRERRIRLENIPVMKPLLIGGAVSTACVLVPWVRADRVLGDPSAWSLVCMTAAIFSLCGANSLLFDLRDADDDRRKGVPTAPVVLGARFTRRLISALLVLALLLALALPLSRGSWGLGLASIGLFCVTWLLPLSTSRTLYSLTVDGMLALPSLVLLLRTAHH